LAKKQDKVVKLFRAFVLTCKNLFKVSKKTMIAMIFNDYWIDCDSEKS